MKLLKDGSVRMTSSQYRNMRAEMLTLIEIRHNVGRDVLDPQIFLHLLMLSHIVDNRIEFTDERLNA